MSASNSIFPLRPIATSRKRRRVLVVAIVICLTSAPTAWGKKHCTCVASTGGWNSGVVHNYGRIESYPDLFLRAPKACTKACSDLVSGKSGMEDATALCATNHWVGGCVRGYGYIGSIGTNNVDGTAGRLNCQAPVAPVTQQKCQPGWLANTTNQDGGVAADGKCKRLACVPLKSPLPPNGTPLGTWGFSWGDGIWQWGSPGTVVVTPAKAGSGFWSGC